MKRTLVLALALIACGSDDGVGPNLEDIDFDPALEIDLSAMTRTASGLYFQDLTVGDGVMATAGNTVVVDYSGWLPNGTLFDSGTSSDWKDPSTGAHIPFILGVGGVIAGFDEGVQGMREGGTWNLVIPPAIGYGAMATGNIPANSVLIFRITLTEIQ